MTGWGRKKKPFINKNWGSGKVQCDSFSDVSFLPRIFAVSVLRGKDRDTNFHGILTTTFMLGWLPRLVIVLWLAQCMFIYKQIQGDAIFCNNWLDHLNFFVCFSIRRNIRHKGNKHTIKNILCVLKAVILTNSDTSKSNSSTYSHKCPFQTLNCSKSK